ncbi:hypothetical protein BO70DRAFT_429476 [Aspergillus heteromorphus CBS 117.55]|uniref:Uncharacterized protein n=1 Tax=Aspergillus heteromorphus CBS 117.55 TaxID=1448321 RepID=A0A317WAC3_9EURO|nr:uncharacterized protein BO70DRAFT_429476 [Aspergillus heteromorphus CBS 117.55]PWY81948.1 hypothetical protein BO70DRAFT_429476 [Aspergillus heteromorphus CBS 117.55]
MQFWLGWPLWQKLSFVLACLLALVLLYSFGVLAYNRQAMKKYAAAEARQRAEMQPMLTETSEIPFGARALERGIQVEGIWTPECRSARQSVVLSGSEPASIISAPALVPSLSPSNIQGPERVYQPVSIPSIFEPHGSSKVPDIEHGRPENTYVPRTSRSFQLDSRGNNELDCLAVPDKRRSKGWFGARGSWVKKPFEGYKRRPALDGHRRTSSESFRRRISKLIDENIRTNPAEIYQLNAINQEAVGSHRTPLQTT